MQQAVERLLGQAGRSLGEGSQPDGASAWSPLPFTAKRQDHFWHLVHKRRLNALIDSLEASFDAEDAQSYVAYDLYVARLMDLSDVLMSVARAFRG